MKLETKIKKLEELHYPVHEMTLGQILRYYNMIIKFKITEPYNSIGEHPSYKGSSPSSEFEEIPLCLEHGQQYLT